MSGAGRGYRVFAGIRRLNVSKTGALSLNGKKVRLRGVSLHEADEQAGGGLDAAGARRQPRAGHDSSARE